MRSITKVVRNVLAYHTPRDARAIGPSARLYGDLGLTTLALVLVMTDIEEIEDLRLPIEELPTLQTVDDLFAFVSRASARAHRVDAMQVHDRV